MDLMGIPRKHLSYLTIVSILFIIIVNFTSLKVFESSKYFTITYVIVILAIVFGILVIIALENKSFLCNLRYVFPLLLIVILGFILRVFSLTEGGLHMDELWRLDRGRQVILSYYWTEPSQSSPVTTILVGLTSLIGGHDPLLIDFWTRFVLGSIVSTLSIIIVYLIGARIGNESIGLLSSFFLALSFEHLRLSRTFMSESYIAFFVAVVFLVFLMSLRKPNYAYATALLLAVVCLIKPTGFALVPIIFLGYFFMSYKKQFPFKDSLISAILFVGAFLYLNVYILSSGDLFGFFFGPLTSGLGAVHASQPVPWLHHFNFLYLYDTLIFCGVFLTLVISIIKKEMKPFFLFFVGITTLLLITFITFKGNDIFHRHLTTVVPLFAVMAGYSFYNIGQYIYHNRHLLGVLFFIMIIVIPPINLYLHSGEASSDQTWIHYNANVKGIDPKTIGLDLKDLSEQNSIAAYFCTPFETSVYGSLTNYYMTDYFTNFSSDQRSYAPIMQFIPKDSLNSLSDYAKRNGIEYILYNSNSKDSYDLTNFTLIKTYPGQIQLLRYDGPTIVLGTTNSQPYDNPFTVISENYGANRTYIWIEAENELYSHGVGSRPYGDESSLGHYGISSNGVLHFVRNAGTYSAYLFDVLSPDTYRLWIRLGAHTPVGVNFSNETSLISPNSSNFSWYCCDPVQLDAGKQEIRISSLSSNYAIYDALLLTNDLNYTPSGTCQPIILSGKPTKNIEHGYRIWEDNLNRWHLEWTCMEQKQLYGSIYSDGCLNVIHSPSTAWYETSENNSVISFIISNTTERINDVLVFSSSNEYVYFNLN